MAGAIHNSLAGAPDDNIPVNVRLSVAFPTRDQAGSGQHVITLLQNKLTRNPRIKIVESGGQVGLYATALERVSAGGQIEHVVAITVGIYPISSDMSGRHGDKDNKSALADFEEQMRDAMLVRQMIVFVATEGDLPEKASIVLDQVDQAVIIPLHRALKKRNTRTKRFGGSTASAFYKTENRQITDKSVGPQP